jgi:hypothetical protein
MAGPGGRLAGIASAFINGVPVTAKGACEYQPVGTKREAIYGMDGLAVGFSETGEAPYISFDMIDTGNIRVADYYVAGAFQVVVNLANGKIVTGHSMMMMEPPVPKNDDATYTTRWTAMFGGTVVETPSAG